MPRTQVLRQMRGSAPEPASRFTSVSRRNFSFNSGVQRADLSHCGPGYLCLCLGNPRSQRSAPVTSAQVRHTAASGDSRPVSAAPQGRSRSPRSASADALPLRSGTPRCERAGPGSRRRVHETTRQRPTALALQPPPRNGSTAQKRETPSVRPRKANTEEGGAGRHLCWTPSGNPRRGAGTPRVILTKRTRSVGSKILRKGHPPRTLPLCGKGSTLAAHPKCFTLL